MMIEILIIGAILMFVLIKNNKINTNKFIQDNAGWLRKFKEDDYDFLVRTKYGSDADPDKLFDMRVRNAMIVSVVLLILFISDFSILNVVLAIGLGYIVFRSGYSNLKSYYKSHLHEIDLQLPYFLKSMEVLAQHFTIPVALAKSIDSAPDIFKPGLERLVQKINDGDSSVNPYMEFAKEYPVSDSMRMMRLLYRLGLSGADDKHEQLIMFSKSVSSLQNKAREIRYKERLTKMENKTMLMLCVVGGGTMIMLVIAMLQSF